MYTKVDLIENEKMNKIIKENQKRIREMDKKNAKQQKRHDKSCLFIISSFMV